MSTITPTPPQPGGPGAPGGPGPRRRRSPGAWALVVLGAVLAAVLVASAAGNLVGLLARTTSTGGEVLEGVAAVQVRNECAGDVQVEAGRGSAATGAVEVRWEDTGVLRRPEHRQRLDGDRLLVEVDCPALSLGVGPTSDLALTVPTGAAVDVETGSGDVRAAGLGGAVALETGSGDVDVERAGGDLSARTGSGDVVVDGVEGDLRARTGSGSVVAEAVGSRVVEVSTGSGDLQLAATEPPQRLTGRTGSGDVLVELPDDGRGYAVETDTGSGEVEVGVTDDPAAGRTVALRTGSGDVTVVPAG